MARATLLAILLAGVLVAPAQGAVGFAPTSQSPVPTGAFPYAVMLTDLNGDGELDALVANQSGSSVSTLVGNGTGQFSAAGLITRTFGTPVALARGDWSGDGQSDVAVADYGTNSVVPLGNAGSSGFVPFVAPTSVGTHPWSLAVADYDRNGHPDIAVADHASNDVYVLLDDNVDVFTKSTQSPITTGDTPSAVATADFNGDGKPDLAVSNLVDNDVVILIGQGNGLFVPATGSPITVGGSPRDVQAADLNGDGKIDLATANGDDNTVSVLLGNGDGTFHAATAVATGAGPYAITVADFDGDHHADMAIANTGANTVTVVLGDGTGAFTAAPGSPYAVGVGPFDLASGDIDDNDAPDIVAANANDNDLTVLLNTIAPVRVVTGAPLAFGTQATGTLSATLTVTLGSSAAAALKVAHVRLTGPDRNDFIVSDDECTGTVEHIGAPACSVTVRFAPSSAGSKTAALTVTDNGATPANIALTGTGGALPTGATGATGAVGATGTTGATGDAGATGAEGIHGPSGEIGPTGPAGPKGPRAKVTCAVKKAKHSKVKVTCVVKTTRAATARLTHRGRTVARRRLRAGRHRVVFRLGASRRGRYVLHLG